jgi:hypothetical protein
MTDDERRWHPDANYTAIPDSVLNLLRKRWRLPEGYSAFDIFNDPQQPDRQRDPSFYFIRTGQNVADLDFDVFSHAEAAAMINDEAFGHTAAQTSEWVALNEHAQHAMQDFCSEVYEAWAKFEERIRLVQAARAGGPRHTE